VESKNSSWNKGIHPVELELLTNRRPIDVPMEDEKPRQWSEEQRAEEPGTGGVALAFAAGV